MAELVHGTTKTSLLKLASPFSYQTRAGKTTLMACDSQAEITIIGQNKRFWITEFVPTIYNANGTIPDGVHHPLDDISVHITLGGIEMTEQYIPVFALQNKQNSDLFAGKIIEPNNSIVFRFACNRLNSTAVHCVYPLTIYMTLKGYDLPNI